MIHRNVSVLTGATILLLAATSASAEIRGSTDDDGSSNFAVAGDVLYGQLDDPSGSAFTDQSFEASYAAYDSTGADDFAVLGGFGWTVEVINTPGSVTLAGSNPLFVNHAFYEDAGGQPGGLVDGCDFPANTDFTSDGDGNLSTNVDCGGPGGTFWVSQNVRQDFDPFGQHFWATRAHASGSPAVWKNPGNGFASGCLEWTPANAVCGVTGEDYLFELLGEYDIIGDCLDPSCNVPAVDPFGIAVMVLAVAGGSAYVLRRRA